MHTSRHDKEERDKTRDALNREELIDRLQTIHQEDGIIQPLEGVFVARTTKAMNPVYGVVQPSLCIIRG